MRPKPTREWVMTELERLGVRVVSGRLGRKAGEDDEGEIQGKPSGRAYIVLQPHRICHVFPLSYVFVDTCFF